MTSILFIWVLSAGQMQLAASGEVIMVQRYTYDQIFGFTPDVEGVLVLYEDYAKLEAELQKYKDQFPDYGECANCGSVTHVEGVE